MKRFGKILLMVFVFAIGATAVYLVASNGGKEVTAPAALTEEGTKVASESGTESQPDTSGPHPRIQFEETVFDWGEVYQQAKVTHIFKFKNVGQVDLNVNKVKSG